MNAQTKKYFSLIGEYCFLIILGFLAQSLLGGDDFDITPYAIVSFFIIWAAEESGNAK
jgi:hypothetical protein